MENLSIFKNISKDEVNEMLKSFEAKTKSFKKGDLILSYIGNYGLVGIILEGEASLLRYDKNGNKTLVEKLIPNSIFGDPFSNYNTDELEIIASKNTKVVFMNYYHITKKCNENATLAKNFFELLTNKLIVTIERCEILTKKTIRDKLLTYFTINSKRLMSKTFTIPFSYTDLADYLGIDRSAMQRELKNLKEDGIIKTKNRKITINF